jgi:hypothetical protein
MRAGPKQNTKISARKKHASSRHNGKDAKVTRQPRTLRQAKKQNRREYSAFGEQVNEKGRNRHDELAANEQVNPNDAPGLVSGRASVTQGPIDQQHGRPASSHDPRQGMQPKQRLDDAHSGQWGGTAVNSYQHVAHAGDSVGVLAVRGNSDGRLSARLDFREFTVAGSPLNAMTIGCRRSTQRFVASRTALTEE